MYIKRYKVAKHVFSISCDDSLGAELEELMDSYSPFEIAEGEPLFCLEVNIVKSVQKPDLFKEETRQVEEGQTIVCGQMPDDKKVLLFDWSGSKAVLTTDKDYRKGVLSSEPDFLRTAVDNSLMMIYAFATSKLNTLLFHSSTVVWQGRGYMFLGVSGTGKSTHSRLWLKNISDTHLLNDDNPVVRVDDNGTPVVYGSPWSGKTPCYRNEAYPVGAIVKLRQYPENIIRNASVLEAYVALSESVSGKRWEKDIADGLHSTIESIIKTCGVYRLDCLPDDEAAEVCWKAVAVQDNKGCER